MCQFGRKKKRKNKLKKSCCSPVTIQPAHRYNNKQTTKNTLFTAFFQKNFFQATISPKFASFKYQQSGFVRLYITETIFTHLTNRTVIK